MMKRVELVGDPELDAWPSPSPAVVEVTTRDRRRLVRRVEGARGTRANPMMPRELEDKF